MNWRTDYQRDFEGSCQQGDSKMLPLEELTSAGVKKYVRERSRRMGVSAGNNPHACRQNGTDNEEKRRESKISSLREKFNKSHRMYLKEGREVHYTEMLAVHNLLSSLEVGSIDVASSKLTPLRSRLLDLEASTRPTRKAEQKTWDESLNALRADVSSRAKTLSLHAAHQFERLRAFGLDQENEQQVLGSVNVQPAASPQPE